MADNFSCSHVGPGQQEPSLCAAWRQHRVLTICRRPTSCDDESDCIRIQRVRPVHRQQPRAWGEYIRNITLLSPHAGIRSVTSRAAELLFLFLKLGIPASNDEKHVYL